VNKNIVIKLPVKVGVILEALEAFSFEAYVVGGCVRDSLLERIPHDWDITTNAKPEKVISIFKEMGFKVIETGLKHGTVTVMIDSEPFEITTFRIDGGYSDNRHPDDVVFTTSLKEDLARRDFTINALAYNNKVGLVDYFNGVLDLDCELIKCVGNPLNRFKEDALRILRTYRFASQLGFDIEEETLSATIILSDSIKNISMERIRDEINKILIADSNIFWGLVHNGLLKIIIPELVNCFNFEQHNKHHDKDVFQHILSVVENTPPKLELRLAALLHDIGKPKCFSMGADRIGHFYEHQKVSADMSREILTRLKFDNKTIDKVCLLVYEHMSRYDKLRTPNTKKFINRVGIENLEDLFTLQIADIKGCAKEYQNFDNVLKLKEECTKIIEEKQPLSVRDLKINGKDLMLLGIKQGKEIGNILNQLLEMILENQKLNEKERLLEIVKGII